MKELNGIIIDGVVYLAKINTEAKPRCASCELGYCDGEKMHDTICANILSSNEYFVKSGAQCALSHQWVSVEDALPEDDRYFYLVADARMDPLGVDCAEYTCETKRFSRGGKILHPTHWCPIPPLNPDDKTPTPTDL